MATILVHYGEIALKGRNRPFFERTLADNISRVLASARGRVRKDGGRLLVDLNDEHLEGALRHLEDVFGIVSFAESTSGLPTLADITVLAVACARQETFSSFRVDAQRGSKSLPFTSQDVNIAAGAAIQQETGARVDLEHPDCTVFIEITDRHAYAYTKRRSGPGGLPMGVSGNVLAMLSGGIDSPVAAWKLMRRGCRVNFLHFHSRPFTSPASVEKAADLANVLDRFQFEHQIWLVPFAEAQSEIVKRVPESLRLVLYRAVMFRVADAFARSVGHAGIVTGESIGQVASQTLENIRAATEGVTLPIYRPLAGDDKDDIVRLARRIGTYDISIRPHEDCCTLFLPTRPETRATVERVALCLKEIGVEKLTDDLVSRTAAYS